MRYLMIFKPADATAMENGTPPTQDEIEKMGAFIGELASSGVLLAADGLLASSLGSSVRRTDGKHTVTDGPFTEAKELIGGFAIVQVPSRTDAVHVAKRFLDIAGDGECEVRQMHDMAAFPQ